MVSVVKTVVGARLEARDLFFGFRTIFWFGIWLLAPEPDGRITPHPLFWFGWLANNCCGGSVPMNSLRFGLGLGILDRIVSRFCGDLDEGSKLYKE